MAYILLKLQTLQHLSIPFNAFLLILGTKYSLLPFRGLLNFNDFVNECSEGTNIKKIM